MDAVISIWAAYEAAIKRREAAIKAAFEASVATHPMPEGWKAVLFNERVELHRWGWVGEIAGGDIFAHGEDGFTGAYDWSHVRPEEAPEGVRSLFEAIAADLERAKDKNPLPDYPKVSPGSWDMVAKARWVEAGKALARRDFRAMRALAAAARDAEREASRARAGFYDPPDEATLARAEEILRSVPETAPAIAYKAVVEEMDRHARAVRDERKAQARAEREEARKAREERAEEIAPLGAIIDVSQPYRLRKSAPCVAIIDGTLEYVKVAAWPEWAKNATGTLSFRARVVERRTGMYYGKRTIAVVEAI